MIKKYSVSWTNVFLVRSKGEVQRQIQAPYTKKLLTPLTELSPLSDFIRGKAGWQRRLSRAVGLESAERGSRGNDIQFTGVKNSRKACSKCR